MAGELGEGFGVASAQLAVRGAVEVDFVALVVQAFGIDERRPGNLLGEVPMRFVDPPAGLIPWPIGEPAHPSDDERDFRGAELLAKTGDEIVQFEFVR